MTNQVTKTATVGSVTILCGVMLMVVVGRFGAAVNTSNQAAVIRPTVVVDAGHGGFDGGAVAPDGTQEKDLNISIASSLADMLTLLGYDVIETRTDDSGLDDGTETTIREKKVSDMKQRLALYDKADLNISIHQNMFGASAYHGAQMFYSANNPLSKPLATLVRKRVYEQLQPDNTRELKSGNKDIYLLYKTVKPTVLVECGFLSNAQELENLKNEAYQRRLAFGIACGTLEYTAQYIVKGG